jgi:hypothetical protein
MPLNWKLQCARDILNLKECNKCDKTTLSIPAEIAINNFLSFKKEKWLLICCENCANKTVQR